MTTPKECTCDNGESGILLYAVISFDYVNKQFFIHSVDRTERRAEDHKLMIQNEYRMKEHRAMVRIEKFESDHAFAQMMKI